MALYMDIHRQVEGLTGDAVSGAHARDLDVQEKYGVNYLKYWFDEGTGTLAHDSSGSGFNGTAVGTSWGTGKTNSGLSFNGTSSYVVTPSIPSCSAFKVPAEIGR